MALALSVLLLTGCGQPEADRTPEPAMDAEQFGVNVERERELLLEADRLFLQTSQTAGLVEAYRRFLAPDAIQLMSGYPAFQGRDNIVANVAEFAEVGLEASLRWDVEGADAAASGDLGYTWGTYIYSGPGSDGEMIDIEGKYVNVWRKSEAGQWEVAVDIGNKQIFWPEDFAEPAAE